MRRALRVGVAALILTTSGGSSAGAPSGLRISAKPRLFPGFGPGIADYVSRCRKGKPLQLSIDAPRGAAVGVDGAAPRSGRFTSRLPLRTGQATVLVVRSGGQDRRVHVRCLPRDFPRWRFKRSGSPQAQWYLIAPVAHQSRHRAWSHYVTIIDGNGVPVWWQRRDVVPFNSILLGNGEIAWARWYSDPFGLTDDTGWEIHSLDGRLLRTMRTRGSPTDLHDMEPLPNGDYLLLTYRLRRGVDLRPFGGPANGAVYDGEIQEQTAGGRVVWSWSSKDHVRLSEDTHWRYQLRTLPDGTKAWDYFHLNAVQPDGDGYLISARHVDAVYRIDRATGDVRWKLGGTHRPESLTVHGDTLKEHFRGQHDARLLPDGTLTVYDNHVSGSPRALRFRIDAAARTATLLQHLPWRKAYSAAEGSARRLPGGDWVISWGATNLVSEVTAGDHDVWRLRLADGQNYRAQPIPFGQLKGSRLRAAMDRMHPVGQVHRLERRIK